MNEIEKKSYFYDGFMEKLNEAGKVVTKAQSASFTLLQRKMKIGFAKAVRAMEALEEAKVVGPAVKDRPRDVLMTSGEWDEAFRKLSQAARDFDGPFSMEEIDEYMTRAGFARFCGGLLRKNGFAVVSSAADADVGLIVEKDGVRYAVFCKNHTEPVECGTIRDAFFNKAMSNCHVACVLTSCVFTPEAEELANQAHVLLWDRAKLIKFMEAADQF